MPDLVLKSNGKKVFVPSEGLSDAIASGLYEEPDEGAQVNVELRPGAVGTTTIGDLGAVGARGANLESEETFRGRERSARIEREHGGVLGSIGAFAENAANEITLGGYGALGEAIGGQDYTDERLERSEANPYAAAAGSGVGLLAPGLLAPESLGGRILGKTPLGLVNRAGQRLGKAAEGAGAITKIARAGIGGAVEGAGVGLGQGVQELVNSDDPLTVERAASVLSSNAMFGGVTGGVAGSLGKAAEIGLSRGKAALERAAARGVKAEGISADLAGLDAKGLRAAKQAELDAIEQARVPQRAQLADDLAAHRSQMVKDKILLATKGAEDAEVRALAARSAKADKSLRGLLDNPIALAEKPQLALSALQRQQSALEGIVAKDEAIRASFTSAAASSSGEMTWREFSAKNMGRLMKSEGGHGPAMTAMAKEWKAYRAAGGIAKPEASRLVASSGARAAALDAVPAALERNKALQARLGELAAAPASSRLSQIADAADLIASGGPKESVAKKMLGGTLFGIGAGAVAQSGIPGSQYLAPIAGAGLAGVISSRMAGKFGAAIRETEARAAKALGVLLDVSKKVTGVAPVLATKVLSRVRYGSPSDDEQPVPRSGALAHSFKRRADEIRSQVVTGQDGAPVAHPQARAKIAKHLSALAATNPILADKLETLGARKLEYLAAALPKRPDLAGLDHGPDTWRPSDMEMRSWARRAAAADDPIGVFERAAAGTVSPEDAETLRAIYPEMLNDFKRQIIEGLPNLRKKLPFQRRLALSILTGVPVDPALDPRILRVLQSQYALEEGTEGGTQAPKAMPAFGSVRSQDKSTPAQERAG